MGKAPTKAQEQYTRKQCLASAHAFLLLLLYALFKQCHVCERDSERKKESEQENV